MIKKSSNNLWGFTLVELMVAISIIGILSAIVYANFGEARKSSRDDIRKTSLKELQLAIEFYKAQNGSYPVAGCSPSPSEWVGPGPENIPEQKSCDVYILGLVPDYIPALPIDPISENSMNRGFLYRTNSDYSDYKAMIYLSVEIKTIKSYSDEFARCSSPQGSLYCPAGSIPESVNTYAVYSAGAATW